MLLNSYKGRQLYNIILLALSPLLQVVKQILSILDACTCTSVIHVQINGSNLELATMYMFDFSNSSAGTDKHFHYIYNFFVSFFVNQCFCELQNIFMCSVLYVLSIDHRTFKTFRTIPRHSFYSFHFHMFTLHNCII